MTDSASQRDWYGTKETAAYLGVSVAWLWRHKKRGPPSYFIAGSHRYRIKDIDAWVEQQRRPLR